MRRRAWVLVALLSVAGCDDGGEEPDPCALVDCEPGFTCTFGECVESGNDAGPNILDAGSVDAGCPADRDCPLVCCAEGDLCWEGSTCIPDLGTCTIDDDCVSDSYCATDGRCVPYGVPPDAQRNEQCVQEIDIEAIVPAVQCSFEDPPPMDPYPNSDDLQGTPLVVDFDFDDDPSTLQPSIVFQTWGGPGGEVLRVIDGATCALQHNIATGFRNAGTPALGDLDGDGRAEIVANTSSDQLRAYAYDVAMGEFVERWAGASCDPSGTRTDHFGGDGEGSSPSLHDLDDDGRPEILIGGSVYDADGCLLASLGTNQLDLLPVVADVDEDGEMEIVSSRGVFRFDASVPALVPESYYAGTTETTRFAFTAVGDFGNHPVAALGGGDFAEIVTVAEGNVRIETLDGTRLLTGTLPSGRGGPPTVADFDGDGRAEVALAARAEYVVFDLDCLSGGDTSGCGGVRRTDGRLWSAAVTEGSSGLTGSSVFDFDADGQAEVVYHDECFVRIFSGADGAVLYSFPRSSLTWFEMPVVVDADGDFHSEIVIGASEHTGSCPATDPFVPSVSFMSTHGVFVLRDELDRWAASRPVWNQHAYSVTHIGDRGEVPASSAVASNHRDPTLNNFRQNVQGDLEPLGVADLTSSVRGVTPLGCRDGVATVTARVCNRGRLPLGGGLDVALRADAFDGAELCRTTIAAPISTGECVTISCTAMAPGGAVDVYVVPDPDDVIDECNEANSWGVLEDVVCVPLE